MMLPDEERKDSHAEHARRGDLVAEQRLPGEDREELAHDPEARQRQDVHLRVAEEPEQVLVQVRAAAQLVDEERGLRRAVGDDHVHAADQHRRGQHEQEAGGQHRPDEHRQPAPAHAGRPVADDRDDDVEAGQDDRDAHQAERERVRVHALARLDGQRRVAGPAGREAAEQEAGQQDHVGARGEPEGQRLEPRERDPLRADHDRHQVVAERPDDDRGHHHHHHGAVLADHLQVGGGAEHVVARREQLGPDRHGQQAAGEEVDQHADQVLDADHLVVERVPEVPGEAADGFPLLLKLRYRPAEHLPDQVVEHAEPDQPAEHQEGIAEHDRHVVAVGRPAARRQEARGHEVAEPVPEDIADDRADERGVPCRAQPPRALLGRAARLTSAGRLRAFRLGFDGHISYLATFLAGSGLLWVGRVVVTAARAGQAELLVDLAHVGDRRSGRRSARTAAVSSSARRAVSPWHAPRS